MTISLLTAMASDRCADLVSCRIVSEDQGEQAFYPQGAWILIICDYTIHRAIGRPGHGLEIYTEDGVFLGGLCDFLGDQLPHPPQPGQRLTFIHRLKLNFAPGTYSLTAALGSQDPSQPAPYKDYPLGHQAFFQSIREHCRWEWPRAISIVAGPQGKLSHFGLVELQGQTRVKVENL